MYLCLLKNYCLDKVPACSKRRIRCFKYGRMFGPRCVNGKWQCCAHGGRNYCKQPKTNSKFSTYLIVELGPLAIGLLQVGNFLFKFFWNISFILETTCKDLARRCTHYNEYGLCEGKYAKWMSKNCKKTCQKCSGNENKGKCIMLCSNFFSISFQIFLSF